MGSSPGSGDADITLAGLATKSSILRKLRIRTDTFAGDLRLPGAPQPVVTVAGLDMYDEQEVATFFGRPLKHWNNEAKF